MLPDGFNVPKKWGVFSFSSLVGHRDPENRPGRGEEEPEPDATGREENRKVAPDDSLLPRGNITGLCFHEIMEEIEFTEIVGSGHESWSSDPGIRDLIEAKMRKYGLIAGKQKGGTDPLVAERYPLLCGMIHQTLNAPVSMEGGCFRLCEISKEDTVSEMEFFYSVTEEIQKETLRNVAKSLLPDPFKLDATGKPVEVAFRKGGAAIGFMNGSIDLVFRKDGRFYFADWKTNALPEYDAGTMWRTLFDNGYVLQYLIYSLALDRYLSQRFRGYRFDEHFGGGIYAFVRGIAPDGGTGLFCHRIGMATLNALEACVYGKTVFQGGLS
jgi:exodeoxyribonuclease V beta subunit